MNKNPRIAILAFGSLLWDNKGLSISKFKKAEGLQIPIDVCRISRDGRLTLCVSEQLGTLNNPFYAISKRKNVDKIFEELRVREGVKANKIVLLDVKNNLISEKANTHLKTAQNIIEWGKINQFDYILYAGQGAKFRIKLNIPFSPLNAVRYVNLILDEKTKKLALNYIKKIDKSIITPTLTILRDLI